MSQNDRGVETRKQENIRRFRQFFKYFVGLIGMGVFVISCYYTWEVFRARSATPSIIKKAMESDNIVIMPEDLSAKQLKALLIYQDPNFFTHKGWDFSNGIITTITQSLVKKLYFKQFKPGIAKIRQSLIARFVLEPQMSKREQLCLFINITYLGTVDGQPVVGFAQGAKVFYNKNFEELTFDEYLSLLDFDNPDYLNPHVNPEGNRRLVLHLKQRLSENGNDRPAVQ